LLFIVIVFLFVIVAIAITATTINIAKILCILISMALVYFL
jgi:hypothetical protein